MKQNDWIALNLNIEGVSGIDINNLRAYNITPENTGLQDKEYYRTIPQVKQRFTDNTGVFNEESFNNFYDSAKRSYNEFASDDYIKNLINTIPSSKNDIFSLGNVNIRNDSAYIINSRDPQRHSMGIGNIFETGAPSFSEREIAQANKAVDENGNTLDWSPNDKGNIIKALFRPTLALAQYDEDEFDENGNLLHQKGERKYNEFGDPYYEVLGDREIYGRDILRFSDTLTKEGTWLNKIDIFDQDGIRNSTAKTLLHATAKIVPYLTPYGYAFGALEAAIALGQTIPVLTKMLNGVFGGDEDLEKLSTSVENWMSRFGRSQSDYQRSHRWGLEGITEMVLDSAAQLYSQRLIQKIPGMIAKWKNVNMSVEAMKRAQTLSIAYMATTSAKDVYGEYKQAGLNDAMAGIGSFATMLAYFAFMQNSYFKDILFRDSAIELPELKILLNRVSDASSKELAAKQLAINNITTAVNSAKKATANQAEKKWFKTVFTSVSESLKKALPKLKELSSVTSPYLYTSRSLNEGIEEVMEEGVSDFFKGLSLGLNAMGIDVKDSSAEKIDFGFSTKDFLERYATAFVGGAIGGAVFEGLTQWDNKVLHRNINRISDLSDVDEQMDWYIRNGYGAELLKLVDQWEKKGKFGTKELSWNYKIQDGNIVYDAAKGENNQNSAIANIIRQRIKYKAAQLDALGLNMTDNEILAKAIQKIEKEAEAAGYIDANQSQEQIARNMNRYEEEKLRDARIDFLKETGVDKFIISDVVDFQKKIIDLEEKIETKRAELNNVPDEVKSKTEIKDTPEIKRLQKQYDQLKKQLEDILSGKAASQYLEEGIFVSNSQLVNLYTSELDGKSVTWFEKQVENFTRSMYSENYNELSDGEKELLKSEFLAWKNQEKRKDRIRHAFRIHQHLTQLITPVIEQQVKDYYGYKLEDARSPIIKANLESILLQQEAAIEKQLEKATTPEEKLKLELRLYTIKNSIERNNQPRNVLETSLLAENEESAPKIISDLEDNLDISSIIPALIEYYQELNNSKIVSEFSDDILKDGLEAVGELIKANFKDRFSEYKRRVFEDANNFNENFETLIQTQKARPELNTVRHNVTNANGDIESKTEAEILQDLYNAWIDVMREPNATGIFVYNGNKRHLTEHLQDRNLFTQLATKQKVNDIDDETGEPIEIEISVNPFQPIIDHYRNRFATNGLLTDNEAQDKLSSLVETFGDSFTKGFDSINVAYKKLTDYAAQLGQANMVKFVSPNSFVDSFAFLGDSSIMSKLEVLKQLRADRIKTPILEWVNALSTEVNGLPVNLWQMLVDEIKGLESKDRLEQYTISNPFALQELEYLEGALTASRAVAIGMQPGQTNQLINNLREVDGLEPLYTFENEQLSNVYNNDITVLQQRVAYLLDLHNKNFAGTVRQKKQSMIVNAPLIVKSLIKKTSTSVNEDQPELFIAAKLKEIGIDDIKQLWIDSGGTESMLDEVTENNFNEFWAVYRTFQNNIYDRVANWTPTGVSNKIEFIAKTLVSGFTELWKFKMSNFTHQRETSKIENFDILMWLASSIAIDPRVTNGLIKTVRSNDNSASPFFDQLLGIQSAFASLENSELFDAIVDAIYESQKEAISKLQLKEDEKNFLLNKSRIKRAIFIDGAAGTGKSQVVLKYIREMRKLLHPDIEAIAVSEYEERTAALKQALGITDENTYVKSELIKKILGRELTADDYERITDSSTHYRILTESVKKEIKKKTDRWKDLLKDKKGIDIYIDESGFLSEADFQFFNEAATNGIHFIYAGDKMQNGHTVTLKNGVTNSGIFDIIGLTTPRLDLSMRAGNLGMVKNLQYLEKILRMYLDIYQNEPWTAVENLTAQVEKKYGAIPTYKMSFYEDDSSLFGVAFTNTPAAALSKLKRIIEKAPNKKIVIITDNIDKWKSERSSTIDVLDIKQVQGGEYDYALIDVQNFGKSKTFDYLRNVYTLISRARTGVYINGSLGQMFPNTVDMDNTASIIVNPTANSEENDMSLIDYSEFFKKLYENELWRSSAPESGKVTVDNEGKSTPPPTTVASPTASISSVTKGERPGNKEVNLSEFLDSIAKDGLESPFLRDRKSKSRDRDYRGYQQYNQELQHDGNGSILSLKDSIDWLFDPNSNINELLFPDDTSHSILNGFTINSSSKLEYKRAIRNLMLDLFVLNRDQLQNKYGADSTGTYKAKWRQVLDNEKFNTRVDKFLSELVNAKDEDGYLELYAIRDGEYGYLYYISDEGYAFPIARVKGLIQEGGIKLKPTEITPMLLISTNANIFRPVKDVVGEYAEIDDDAYIIKMDGKKVNELNIAEGSGVEGFIWNNLGKPQLRISTTFGDDDAIETMEPQMSEEDGEKIFGIDSTHKFNGRKRLDAAAQWVSLSQWIALTRIAEKIRKNEASLAEKNEIKKYLSNSQAQKVDQLTFNPDVSDLFYALGGISILSDDSRALLTTALFRYFYAKGPDDSDFSKFLDNIFKWNGAEYTSTSDGVQYKRQKGFEFTINGVASKEEYHILDAASENFRVLTYTKGDAYSVESEIGTLTTNQWLNVENPNPIEMARNVLMIAKANRASLVETNKTLWDEDSIMLQYLEGKRELTDEEIENFLKDGTLTIGIVTRSQTVKDDQSVIKSNDVKYFKPFDIDILHLLDDITVDPEGDLESFLRSDTKFKYQFLVNTPGTDWNENRYWMRSETNVGELLTDLGAIIPPLLNIGGQFVMSTNVKFTSLGLLAHKTETSNLSEIVVTVVSDDEGKPIEYRLNNKKIVLPTASVAPYVSGLDITTPTVTILRASPTTITIKLGSGSRQYNVANGKNPLDLFAGAKIEQNTVNGDTVVIKNENGWKLVKRSASNELVLVYGNISFNSPKLVFENDNEIGLWAGNKYKVVRLLKTNSDKIGDELKKYIDGEFLGSIIIDNELSEEYFLLKNKIVVVDSDGQRSVYTNVSIDSDGSLYGTIGSVRYEITNNKSIVNAARNNGIKAMKAQKKSDEALAVEQISKGKSDLTKIEGRLTKKKLDAWARQNAIKLGGFYVYDPNNKQFITLNDGGVSDILFTFANWAQQNLNRDAQEVINSNPDVNIVWNDNSSLNTATITLDGTDYKFNFSLNQEGEIKFTQVNTEAPATEISVTKVIENLPSEIRENITTVDVGYLKLAADKVLDSNTPVDKDFENWYDNMSDSVTKAWFAIYTLIEKAQENQSCITFIL